MLLGDDDLIGDAIQTTHDALYKLKTVTLSNTLYLLSVTLVTFV